MGQSVGRRLLTPGARTRNLVNPCGSVKEKGKMGQISQSATVFVVSIIPQHSILMFNLSAIDSTVK